MKPYCQHAGFAEKKSADIVVASPYGAADGLSRGAAFEPCRCMACPNHREIQDRRTGQWFFHDPERGARQSRAAVIRRRNWATLRSLTSFLAIYGLGAVINVLMARDLYAMTAMCFLADTAGAAVEALLNSALTSMFTWGRHLA
jgi:hypothetical protein